MEKILITPNEAGELLSLSVNKVRELCNKGEIPHTRNGSEIKISVRLLNEWADNKCSNGELI